MERGNLEDLRALIAVARERSFTRAAAQLGVSQSALSQTIRQLESRIGVRLLTRTTRSVSLTEAGERLVTIATPRLEEIDAELDAIKGLRDKPKGRIRITAGDHAIKATLWPKLITFAATYPDIKVEVAIDYGLADIAAERYDAGVRLGEQVARDMIAVRIGPDVRFAVVGAKSYFANHPRPDVPQDLVAHDCVNLRLPTYGGLYAWEFEKASREVKVRVDGQFVFNSVYQVLDAALAGRGLAFVPEDIVERHVAKGRLIRVLDSWCAPWSGYHIYYAHRRQSSPAFSLLIEALRYGKRN